METKNIKLENVEGIVINGQYYMRSITAPSIKHEFIITQFLNEKKLRDCIVNNDDPDMVDYVVIKEPYYDMETCNNK
jgi:hypothetical protein